MKVAIVDIPHDANQLATWLEDVITGPNLARSIRELCLLQRREPLFPPVAKLADVLGAGEGGVLNQGLQTLSLKQIRQLTAEPELLLQLQELLLLEGSDYWQQKWQAKMATSPSVEKIAPASRSRPKNAIVGVLITVAAALLLMVGVWNWNAPSTAVAWGWNAPTLLSANRSPSEHLNAIAAAGEEWFQQKPTNASELKQRIQDMKVGCERLISAKHGPLSAADELWLKEKCRLWLDKMNSQLTALQDDSSLTTVQKEMDGIVTKLVDVLRQKAKELQA